MKVGSFCTGIGGLDLAVEAHFGAELAWYSEVEPAPITVLEREWPGVPNLGDLTTLDWSQVEPVDIITAGYPCQPFSHAGKRKGASDARHLWPFIAEAVRVLRPRWVVLENVAGHLTLGFGDVLGDLAEAGFDAEWCVLRASDVGAPHRRERVFITAADADERRRQGWWPGEPATARAGRQGWERGASRAGSDAAPDTDGGRLVRGEESNVGTVEPRLEAPRRHDPDGLGLAVAWGTYEAAIQRWEPLLGRPAPHPTDDQGRLAPCFVEWMMGYPDGWVDGLTRTAALKALGNAVVPQQAAAALREIAPSVPVEPRGAAG